MEKLLRLLDTNARLTDAQLAAMLDCTEEEIKKKLTALEREGIVRGYKAVIDWEKTGEEHLTADSRKSRNRSVCLTRWKASTLCPAAMTWR